ncbi:MAG: hypothetical protein M3Q69_05625 [Acidobacteriota bacterium]|nr:hypothetical protein [Acidobacteriota bacterium]
MVEATASVSPGSPASKPRSALSLILGVVVAIILLRMLGPLFVGFLALFGVSLPLLITVAILVLAFMKVGDLLRRA